MLRASKSLKIAPLYRQFFAMIYDSLLIIAILFVATAIMVAFNHGEAIAQQNNPFFSIYLLLIVFMFYGWFWRKSGQTLGMKVWKIKIVDLNGYLPSWQSSFVRLFFSLLSIAAFGLGYWWHLFKGYTWHDKLSQTQIIDLRQTREKLS